MRLRRFSTLFTMALLAGAACDAPQPFKSTPDVNQGFINFETIPTRAVAMSADGSRLFVNNVPDGRLEIFDVSPSGITPSGSVQVGMDPISLAVKSDSEVWVVNHLSDSVSIVDVASNPPRVKQTLLVGDEPRDIVFAGPNNGRAFITAARRGQNHPVNTVELTQVPGEPRADVWVFDANSPGNSLGGDPLTVLPLFSDKPGSLAATADGSKVFVSIFTSGNKTTVINDSAICSGPSAMAGTAQNSNQNDGPCMLENGRTSPGGVPAPNVNQADGARNPRTGIIATNNPATGAWVDVAGRDFRNAVPFEFPDNDVFTINAGGAMPRVTGSYQGVSTLNFNLVVDSAGTAYLANIDAINQNRFISLPGAGLGPNPNGPGPIQADPISGKALRGHLYESRVAILNPDGSFVSRHLNKHIDYEAFPVPAGTKERSIAQPQSLILSADEQTLIFAGLGSNKLVSYSVAGLKNDSFVPNAANNIPLSGNGGPADLVLDPNDPNRVFVYKRFDNAVSIVDLAAKSETASVPLFNPEPSIVSAGRKFFYSAETGSDNGEANCSVCHPSADKDDLAWNLGSPFLGLGNNPNQFVSGIALGIGGDNNPSVQFNPIKGPMTVLTLRGIKDSGPMFWRGDMTTPGDVLNTRANFTLFNIVFDALNGKTGGLADSDMAMLTNWALTLVPPPNPHRPLNNTPTPDQNLGRGVFTNMGEGAKGVTDVIFICNSCHALDRGRGQFGAGGMMSTEGETQFFKVTQLRTVYDKVGMFGHTFGDNGDARTLGGARTAANIGDQVRATGTLHDGSAAGAEEFLTAAVFQLTAPELKRVVDFTYAMESNVAPVVGQQVTLGPNTGADSLARVALLEQRAGAAFVMTGPLNTTECDLVAKGAVGGRTVGYLFQPGSNNYRTDAGGTISAAALRSQAQQPGQEVTFTCIYPGGGVRVGLDRNQDGTLDGQGGGAPAPGPQPQPQPQPQPMQPPMMTGNPLVDFLNGLFGAIFGGFGG